MCYFCNLFSIIKYIYIYIRNELKKGVTHVTTLLLCFHTISEIGTEGVKT